MIDASEVYDKKLNFLIGSGASFGLLPTLWLEIKNEKGNPCSLEELGVYLSDDTANDQRNTQYTALFMHYYMSCIRPAIEFDAGNVEPGTKSDVLKNYKLFLQNIISLLHRRDDQDKRCNIFTTNYDGCFVYAADSIFMDKNIELALNDGANGFFERTLSVSNFDIYHSKSGIFDRHTRGVPQVNVINMHGSVYWKKRGERIIVDYTDKSNAELLEKETEYKLAAFASCLNDTKKSFIDLPRIDLTNEEMDKFWIRYNDLPIVNPTKWKFNETVFEEHYYQSLRMLSYELERSSSVLIVFGFSFKDEHIRSLVTRSLSNPTLQVFICCFNDSEMTYFKKIYGQFSNVVYITPKDGNLDFTAFNSTVLNPSVSQ